MMPAAQNSTVNSTTMNKPARRASATSLKKKNLDLPVADEGLCVLCRHAASDDFDPTISRLGRSCRFEHAGKVYVAHRNCLYASPGLGKNNVLLPDVAFGFSPEMVVNEAKRGKILTCFYCKQKGAVHGCSIKNCSRKFHLYCAVKCNLLCLFQTTHSVYCEAHGFRYLTGTDFVSEEDVKSGDAATGDNNASKDCCICKTPVFENDAFDTAADAPVGDPRVQLSHDHVRKTVERTKKWLAMRLTCCQRNDNNVAHDYVHRWCLERLSERKGLQELNCPNCYEHDSFIRYLTRNGIFLEDKNNDDVESIDLYDKCTADECKVIRFGDDGRNRTYKEETGLYDIGSCSQCGRSLHAMCAFHRSEEDDVEDDDFYCQMCYDKWKAERPPTPVSSPPSTACSQPNLNENTRPGEISKSNADVFTKPRKSTCARRMRGHGSLISDAAVACSSSTPSISVLHHDGFESVLNHSIIAPKAKTAIKNSVTERNVRATSDASSCDSLSSFSSLSSGRSALSVHSTTSSTADADSSQPKKRAKVDVPAEPTAGTSSSAISTRERMRGTCSRQETLAALATAGLGEERHIRFTIKNKKLLFPSTADAVTGQSAGSSTCPACHRVEAVRTFCTIGTQTDAVNILSDAVASSSMSTQTSDLPLTNAVVDAANSAAKSPSRSGRNPSSTSSERTAAKAKEPIVVTAANAVASSVQWPREASDDGDISFECELIQIDD